MQCNPEDIIWGYYKARFLQDVPCALAYCHDDIEVVVHSTEQRLAFAGSSRGKPGLGERLEIIDATWAMLQLDAVVTSGEGPNWRGTIHFSGRHKATGVVFESRMRTLWAVVGGRISRLEQFVDNALMRSFIEAAEARQLVPARCQN